MSKDERWLLEEKYAGKTSEAFLADCVRLAAGEPLAYIIGWVPFLDCRIYLDSNPLIPRPETEFWTLAAIAEIKKYVDSASTGAVRVLDLCAGSGCIGVAIAQAFPTAQVDFCEIDPSHLPTIRKNITHNLAHTSSDSSDVPTPKASLHRVLAGDLFSLHLSASEPDVALGEYDVIVCNPPYIDPAVDRTEAAVRKYEPAGALYGGGGGLKVITNIITAAAARLTPSGQLWLEHEPEQSQAIQDLGQKHGFVVNTYLDQYQIERYSQLMLQ